MAESDQATDVAPLLRMRGIDKSFGGLRALRAVDFDVRAGEVHVLAGENGAGKSTLIKVLGGVHQPDAGSIRLGERSVRFRSPREAAIHGVVIIHQELSLVPDMSVADNVFLGRERCRAGWMRYRRQEQAAAAALGRLGLRLDTRQTSGALAVSVQQMVEIAKALVHEARVIVMDEPTSALNEPEVVRLFACIGGMKARGCGVVYITHKLEEVYRIADRITVLRDGRRVTTESAGRLSAAALVRHMVGRDLMEHVGRGKNANQAGPVKLAVRDFTVRAVSRARRPVVSKVSFDVRAGEIFGLAGLQGSGNSDLLLGLFGAHGRRASGVVRIDSRPVRIRSVREAIRQGVALVTNDRQRTGLVQGLSVAANVTLASLPEVSPAGWVDSSREKSVAAEMTSALRLQSQSLRQLVVTLSGGNQQKVVLAKWMSAKPRVLLLDEPTRGVDVGAKQEIYSLLKEWSSAGQAIVLITSELSELLLLSDRIMVLHRGRVTASFSRSQATQERILHAAMGGEEHDSNDAGD